MRGVATLQDWRNRFIDGDDCPWPGPRPLTDDDNESLLCGRAKDQVAFRQAVDQNKLVILGGRTGIGKSSLLMRGLIPTLRSDGYLVLPCRDWSGAARQTDAASFLAERIRGAVIEGREWGGTEVPIGAALFPFLHKALGGDAVLVLDQFEELIRDAPEFTSQLFKALSFLNHKTSIKIIISLRSEFDHELRPLVQSLKPLSYFTYVLDEIDDEYAVDVVLAANMIQPDAVDPAVAEDLAVEWQKARKHVGSTSIGLLHLQAMLFVLHSGLGPGRVTVSRSDLDKFIDGHAGHLSHEDDSLFVEALIDAVDIKMRRCKQAAIDVGFDSYLLEGTTRLAARMVRHLSSAGYKLVREVYDLIELALDDDFETLVRGMAKARQADGMTADGDVSVEQMRGLLQLLTGALIGDATRGDSAVDLFSSRETIASAADQLIGRADAGPWVGWVDRLHVGADARVVDPANSTSGPMLGLAPAAAMIEELRRGVFALEWLQASQLVRSSSPRVGTTMVALVHDGFGAALDRWSRSGALSACGAIYGLTAPPAGEFVWKTPDGSTLKELDGEKATGRPVRVFANLRWRGAFVKADFRRVVFANCDFRGSQFNECRLEGVTFVNCLLDGLMLSDCTVVGSAVADDDEKWLGSEGEFEIAGVADVAAVLARYREDDASSDVLVAARPQLPTRPGEHVEGRRQMRLHTTGVVVYGGRTSSLLIRRSRFEDGGCISLRETAGSGVDIVEHSDAGRYEVLSSALRHITFTSSPTESGGGGELDIRFEKSIVYQLWIGSDLTGRLTAVDSVLIQAWNGAPGLRAALVLGDDGQPSRHYGLVGFDFEGEHISLVPTDAQYTADDLDDDLSLRKFALSMDYREHASATQQDEVFG